MKKSLFLYLLLVTSTLIFAQDNIFLGIGIEANGNTTEGAAAGGGWYIGMDLNQHLALGLKTTYSYDFDAMGNMEQCVFLRFYLPFGIQGLFLQTEMGGRIFFEDSYSNLMFLCGVAAGLRLSINDNLFLEPVIRGGYPFIWSIGLMVGFNYPRTEIRRED